MMRYSMQAKFSGTLVGAALGASWLERSAAAPSSARFEEAAGGTPAAADSPWVTDALAAAIALTQHLIAHGPHAFPWDDYAPPGAVAGDRLATWLMLLSVPLALFCHDNLPQLRQHLHTATQRWHQPETLLQPALALGQTLSLLVPTHRPPQCLVPMLLDALRPGGFAPLSEPTWQWLHGALEQRHGLALAYAQRPAAPTDGTPLSIALLIFLSQPGMGDRNFVRATTIAPSAATLALVGALLGGYHGIAAFLHGLAGSDRPAWPAPAMPLTEDVTWAQLADDLLATWAGAYEPRQSQTVAAGWRAIVARRPTPTPASPPTL